MYATLNRALQWPAEEDGALGRPTASNARRSWSGSRSGWGGRGPPHGRAAAAAPPAVLVPDRGALPRSEICAPRVGGERRTAGHVEATRGCKHLCRHCPIPPVYEGRFLRCRDIVLEDARAQIAAGARHITSATRIS